MLQRRPPTFCLDCGKPISETAMRCQRCAMRSRARMAPAANRRESPLAQARRYGLTIEQIRWIQGTKTDLQAPMIASQLNVDPAVIQAIRFGAELVVES